MKHRKQKYRMKGSYVNSSDVSGFVHIAKRKEGLCYACNKLIKIGQKYVVVNDYPIFGDPITVHFDEYLDDHPDGCILGVKIIRKKDLWLNHTTGYVECEFFKPSL